ncbi:HIT family protein [Peribacillus kribbensis]|uniref:HIT family protein n=1 Tax=Peribacillus kribbensis TaxID=356658 RepID=UPI00047CADDF|nr:HIT family protein [Peribacillus kribbensis]
MECIGCGLANHTLPVDMVYENDLICVVLDHHPYNEGHVMILPKVHVEEVDELDEETANAVIKAAGLMAKAIKALYKPDGITICQNGGIFSDLSHFHMHVVPRYKHQSFADFYSDAPIDNENARNALAETKMKFLAAIKEIVSSSGL